MMKMRTELLLQYELRRTQVIMMMSTAQAISSSMFTVRKGPSWPEKKSRIVFWLPRIQKIKKKQ